MKTKVLLVMALSVILSASAPAQEKEKKIAFELGGGPSIPTNEFAEGIRLGFGFECTFNYSFMPHTGIYGGWGANWLSTETVNSETSLDYEETGYVLGLDFRHPIGSSNISYYARAGALYNHIETENSDGIIISDTKHGLGYQLAGGLAINLGRNWNLVPGIKFNSLTRDSEINGVIKQLNYQYISAKIGISKKF
ncbi:MAG: porin family protein [Bacteroidetes bacterium]|nr:porin family protein [Bacteroidota bacterium]